MKSIIDILSVIKSFLLTRNFEIVSAMVLSDRSIKEQIENGRIVINPLGENSIQPASVDVHLDNRILVFSNSRRPYIDIKQDMEDLTDLVKIEDDVPFILHPGEFVLGSTLEHVEIPGDLVSRLEGKSSLGRKRRSHPWRRRTVPRVEGFEEGESR